MRILVLGLDNSGKTTIVKQICGHDISNIEPTLGFQILTLQYDGGTTTTDDDTPTNDSSSSNYTINLWDVGGQRTIRAYWKNYFEQTDGIIWVVDSTDTIQRLRACREELHDLLQQERLAGASVLIFANKQDALCRSDAAAESTPTATLSIHEIADILGLNIHSTNDNSRRERNSSNNVDSNNVMKNRHWNIIPCCAINGYGLSTGMDWIVQDIGSRIFMLS